MLIPLQQDQSVTPPRRREAHSSIGVDRDLFGWLQVVLWRGAAGDSDPVSAWISPSRVDELRRDLRAVAAQHPELPLSPGARHLLERRA